MGLYEPCYEVNATSEKGERGREEEYKAAPASIYLLETFFPVLENKDRKPRLGDRMRRGRKRRSRFSRLHLPACLHIDTYPFSNPYQYEIHHLVGVFIPKLLAENC